MGGSPCASHPSTVRLLWRAAAAASVLSDNESCCQVSVDLVILNGLHMYICIRFLHFPPSSLFSPSKW